MVQVKDVASQGLVYCLDCDSVPLGTLDPDEFKDAVLLVMQSQEFDSIPLVKETGSKIVTRIARRTYIENNPIEFLTKSNIDECRRDASLLDGVIRLLRSKHHMVYLKDTDEASEYTDVLTPCMLREKDVTEFFTLLAYRVQTENGKDFLGEKGNLQGYISELELKIDAYTSCFQENDGEGVEDAQKDLRTHLGLLLDANSSEFEPSLSRKVPLNMPESALLYTPRPFGQLHIHSTRFDENVQKLAFQLFTKANDWDTLLTDEKDGMRELLEKDSEGFNKKSTKKIEPSTGLAELVDRFNQEYAPVWFDHDDGYPRIVSPADVVFHPTTRKKMGEQASRLEREVTARIYNTIIERKITYNTLLEQFDMEIKNWSLRNNLELLPLSKEQRDALDKVVHLRNKLFHGEFGLTSESPTSSIAAKKYLEEFLKSDVQDTINALLDPGGSGDKLVQIFEILDVIIELLGRVNKNQEKYFDVLEKSGLKAHEFGDERRNLRLEFYPLDETHRQALSEHARLFRDAGVSLEFDKKSFEEAYGEAMKKLNERLKKYTLCDYYRDETEREIFLKKLQEDYEGLFNIPLNEFERILESSDEWREFKEKIRHAEQKVIRDMFIKFLTQIIDKRIIMDLKVEEISILKWFHEERKKLGQDKNLDYDKFIKSVFDGITNCPEFSFSITCWPADDGCPVKGIRVWKKQLVSSPLVRLLNKTEEISVNEPSITDQDLLDAVELFIYNTHEKGESPFRLEEWPFRLKQALNPNTNRVLFLAWLKEKNGDDYDFEEITKKRKIARIKIKKK